MSAQISFLAGQSFVIQDLSGSGLGFFGNAGFGASVPVGSWQGHTFITDGAGVNQGPEVSNVCYLNAGSGILGQAGSGVALNNIPNYQATLNIRFNYDTPVQVENAQLIIYDRVSTSNPASGVTTATAQIIHPSLSQLTTGSGDTTWNFPAGTGVVQNLCPSPGVSGLYAGNGNNGAAWSDTQHDWFVAISTSPNAIGSKLFGGYVSLEYL